MKTSKIRLATMLYLLIFSCKKDFAMQTLTTETEHPSNQDNNDAIEDGYQYFENYDKTVGMVSSRIKLPKDWERLDNDQQYAFEGPDGMKIGNIQVSNPFLYTEDYSMLQTYEMSGVKNQYPMSIDQIVKTFFMPYANDNNLTYVKSFPLPKVAEQAKAFLELNFTSMPTQIETESAGLEWKDDNGKKYLTILRKTIHKTYNQWSWGFMNQYVEAPEKHFENAKTIFIAMTLSEQHNTNWLYKKNQIAAQKANQQYQAHQARMNALRMRSNNTGFTSSSSVGNTYSDILDINHSGYLKRSNMTSHGQTQTVNMIGERNIISNHNTGEYYNVQSGSKYYWVNNNGKYFSTDNPNYDPRTDQRINETEWSQFQIEN